MTPASRGETLSTVVMTVCAVVATAWLVFGSARPSQSPLDDTLRKVSPSEWAEAMGVGDRIGPPNGAVDLVVFVDYQCPWCRVLEERLEQMREQRFDDLVVVYRQFPIEQLHPEAKNSAIAVECAKQQRRFSSMHRVLFAAQDSIGLVAWTSLAERAGVADIERFSACIVDPASGERVRVDQELAQRLSLRGTPAVLAGATLYRGALDVPRLEAIVAEGRR